MKLEKERAMLKDLEQYYKLLTKNAEKIDGRDDEEEVWTWHSLDGNYELESKVLEHVPCLYQLTEELFPVEMLKTQRWGVEAVISFLSNYLGEDNDCTHISKH